MRQLRLAILLACFPWAPMSPQVPVRPRIRLVVALTVDQLRPDYLERWRGELSGGLGRLLREGVFFPHGEQDHAMTETAPGHSTLMSGRSPASTGILSNDLGVSDPQSPLIGGNSAALGASPRRFLGTTLFDWMVVRDPDTKALSVSRKDRGAILTMGRAKAPIFWYADGHFTTSRYYGDSLPKWLRDWNSREPAAKFTGFAWSLLRDESQYSEADARTFEAGGSDFTFPHKLPDSSARAASGLVSFPWMDSLTLDVALEGARALGLGVRGTDFLAISLSTTDAVGHKWGPGSREMHDQILRLDQWMGWFLDSLARLVPADETVISLSSDHGAQEFPEAGLGGRFGTPATVRNLNLWANKLFHIDLGASLDLGLLMADVPALKSRGVNVDSLSSALAEEVTRTNAGVRKIYTPKTLAAAPPSDAEARRWKNQIPKGTQWLVALSLQDHWVYGTGKGSTGHGTTNLLDLRVPILFRIPGLAPNVVTRTVRTVDIAPTLAAVLGVKPTQRVEGVVLPEVVHPPVRH